MVLRDGVDRAKPVAGIPADTIYMGLIRETCHERQSPRNSTNSSSSADTPTHVRAGELPEQDRAARPASLAGGCSRMWCA